MGKDTGNKHHIERKPREERFGKLKSQPDIISKGQYIPWARSQKPGSVKEISFDSEMRR